VVEQGWTLRAAAEAAGVSVRCARKRVGRYRAGDVTCSTGRRRRVGLLIEPIPSGSRPRHAGGGT